MLGYIRVRMERLNVVTVQLPAFLQQHSSMKSGLPSESETEWTESDTVRQCRMEKQLHSYLFQRAVDLECTEEICEQNSDLDSTSGIEIPEAAATDF